ncbi:methionyl-tRNA formyltransferase [Bacillaceae bacterium]
MRIIFMGTPDFAVPSLKRLVREGHEVVAVVTQPDRPKGRKQTLTPPPVKVAALEEGIPVLQPEKVRESIDEILSYRPDLIVTAAYGQILPRELLEAPPLRCINVHASLLPKYRGGAPIHRAIMEGEKETGITIMYMVEKLDAGDILSQRALPIAETDTVGTLHDKLSELGASLLAETIPALADGTIEPRRQDERLATYAFNIKREDEVIDWTRPAKRIYDQIRGLNPWPVAFTTWRGNRLKVWWAETAAEGGQAEPGTVVAVGEEGITVAAGEGWLRLKRVQPAGRKAMDAADFVRGAGAEMKPGDKLGD